MLKIGSSGGIRTHKIFFVLSEATLPVCQLSHLVRMAGFEPALYSPLNYCLCQLRYIRMKIINLVFLKILLMMVPQKLF